MRKRKRLFATWIVVLMLTGGTLVFVNLSTNAEKDNRNVGIRSASKSGLTAHDPIYIDGNPDFASQASVGLLSTTRMFISL